MFKTSATTIGQMENGMVWLIEWAKQGMVFGNDVLHVLNESLQHDLVWTISASIPIVERVVTPTNVESVDFVCIAFSNSVKQCVSMFCCEEVSF